MKAQAIVRARLLLVALWLLMAPVAHSEQLIRKEKIDVHYSAFHSMFLEPAVALHYNLVRSPEKAILNIAVRAHDDQSDYPVAAEITGQIINLMSQQYDLEFREVREPGAIYYLATFRFTDNEPLRFNLIVHAEGETIPIKFQQRLRSK